MANTQGREKREYRNDDYYVYGNAVRALEPVKVEAPQKVELSNRARRNRDRSRRMNFGYVFFLTVMICVTGVGCIQYLKIQSEITSSVKRISELECRLNELKAENDDTESRIKGSVGLEEIKKRAMEELGMRYATEEQIVKYSSDDTDYVRQYVDID